MFAHQVCAYAFAAEAILFNSQKLVSHMYGQYRVVLQ